MIPQDTGSPTQALPAATGTDREDWIQQLAHTLDSADNALDDLTRQRLAKARQHALAARPAEGARRVMLALAAAASVAALAFLLPFPTPSSPAPSLAATDSRPTDEREVLAWVAEADIPELAASLSEDPELIEHWEMLDAIAEVPDAS
jgi:hypothetical protein